MELFTVDTVLDTTDPGDGLLSLREALALANADADKDEIQFADALAGKTLVLTQGALRIERTCSSTARRAGSPSTATARAACSASTTPRARTRRSPWPP